MLRAPIRTTTVTSAAAIRMAPCYPALVRVSWGTNPDTALDRRAARHGGPHDARLAAELRSLLALASAAGAGATGAERHGLRRHLMVGRLGTSALAGMALGATIFQTVSIVSVAILLSVGPQVAQAVGAKRWDDAGKAARQGLWLALGVCVPGVVLFVNAGAVLHAVGMEPSMAEGRRRGYLRAIAYGFPA
ncbi:MAG: MATE family efflux transporter, partial [Gammaproteobacteria bacterium]|nr:MATE family efflux transporter [Gammaproteobacteria bacterium]